MKLNIRKIYSETKRLVRIKTVAIRLELETEGDLLPVSETWQGSDTVSLSALVRAVHPLVDRERYLSLVFCAIGNRSMKRLHIRAVLALFRSFVSSDLRPGKNRVNRNRTSGERQY